MKKDLFLLLASVVITLILALGVIRWFAPGLLGMPADLQLVQLDDKLPAFFKGVFRDQHSTDNGILIKDPLTRVRAKPFYKDLNGIIPCLGVMCFKGNCQFI